MHSFILSNSGGTLAAEGVERSWASVTDALRALHSGTSMVLGALPFQHSDAPALFTPHRFDFRPEVPALPRGECPRVTRTEELPSPAEHAGRVHRAVADIRSGDFDKVVLAREVRYHLAQEISPELLLRHYLAGSSTGDGHLVDLAAAGPQHRGSHLVGSSPELLIAKKGGRILSFPLAGTIPKVADPARDRERSQGLLNSTKDIAEHAFVTEEIRRVLAPFCEELRIPQRPSLTGTSHTWHLGTRIEGRLRHPEISALELAAALHPTPAVCGFPTSRTREFLREEEPGRGFYAGAVGWSDDRGDGEWRVTIRSAVTRADTVTAHAGGGIVADSVPDDEVRETAAKLGPVRAALGLPRDESTAPDQELTGARS